MIHLFVKAKLKLFSKHGRPKTAFIGKSLSILFFPGGGVGQLLVIPLIPLMPNPWLRKITSTMAHPTGKSYNTFGEKNDREVENNYTKNYKFDEKNYIIL